MKSLIFSLSVLLIACGGGGGGGSNHEEEASRKPFEFEHCKIKLDDAGQCPLSELEHNVPNIGQLCMGACPNNEVRK